LEERREARLTDVVVLPTPPLPFAMTKIFNRVQCQVCKFVPLLVRKFQHS
jgi:hypothetical protein